jgi:hypothetical protein
MRKLTPGKWRLAFLLAALSPLASFLLRTSSDSSRKDGEKLFWDSITDPGPGIGEPDIMPEDHMCPECQQGKHQNCDGLAWDFEIDKLTHCDCEEGDHPLRGETEDGGPDDDGGVN